jgi:serine protease Do
MPRLNRSAAAGALALLLLPSLSSAATPFVRRSQVVEVVEKVGPAVVNIAAEQIVEQRGSDSFFFDFFPGYTRRFKTQGLGTGVIINPSGTVVTNAHVVEGASAIVVTTRDNEEYQAELIGLDENNDLALLRLKGTPGSLPAAPLGTSSDLMIGEPVIAIGNPMGFSNTVTTGVVSALKRQVKGEQGAIYTDFIQTDAAINPGNSGGPLLNALGEVIGINTAIIKNAEGIGFAIPVDRVKKITKDLLLYGEVRPLWTGLKLSTLDAREAAKRGIPARSGAFVEKVYGGSPASRAGLKPGDTVVEAAGGLVASREDFFTSLAGVSAGERMPLTVLRKGERRPLAFTPVTAPEGLGMDLLEEAVGLTVKASRSGMRITAVAEGSQAERIGIEPGDLLLGVNGRRVESADDVNRILTKDFDKESVVLTVQHGRRAYALTFDL